MVDEDKRATLRRFAAAGAAVSTGLTGTAAASESDTREALVGYVTQTPGAHFSKIRDDLQLGTGETQYHLRQLEDSGTVTSRSDGAYRRYFPADQFDTFEQTALGYLRRETPRQMLFALLETPGQTGAALVSQVDVARSTVSTHASALTEAGLIERDSGGYRVQYPETVVALVLRYAESFGEEAVQFASDADRLLSYDPPAREL